MRISKIVRMDSSVIYTHPHLASPVEVVEAAYNADCSFANANLAGLHLRNANLPGANFTGAFLSRTYLSGANLKGANFTNATMIMASISGANITDANFTGANMKGINR